VLATADLGRAVASVLHHAADGRRRHLDALAT